MHQFFTIIATYSAIIVAIIAGYFTKLTYEAARDAGCFVIGYCDIVTLGHLVIFGHIFVAAVLSVFFFGAYTYLNFCAAQRAIRNNRSHGGWSLLPPEARNDDYMPPGRFG